MRQRTNLRDEVERQPSTPVTQSKRRYTALAAQLSRLRQQLGTLRKDYADLLGGQVEEGLSVGMDQVDRDLANMEQIIHHRLMHDGHLEE